MVLLIVILGYCKTYVTEYDIHPNDEVDKVKPLNKQYFIPVGQV